MQQVPGTCKAPKRVRTEIGVVRPQALIELGSVLNVIEDITFPKNLKMIKSNSFMVLLVFLPLLLFLVI